MNEDVSQNPIPENQPSQPQSQPAPPAGGYYAPPPPQYVPPRANGRRWWIPVSIAIGCLPWLILGFLLLTLVIGGAASVGSHGKHVALIRVSGVITAGKSASGMFGGGSGAGSEDLVEQLEKARKDNNAKAIVIRINSPGGSPAGSEEVYNEIMRVRAAGKPVYISMADVAASGGYYIAAASDKIYADASTLTGSIGVIWDSADLSGLYKKIGLEPQVVKSGKFKDIGSPNRAMTPEERALIQGLIMDTYDQFVKSVSEGRKMPLADVKKIADGRVFTGDQAIKLKLVDRIGGMHETVRDAAKAVGIKGEPKVVEYGRKGFLSSLFGGSDDSEEAASAAKSAVTREIVRRMLDQAGSSQGMR